MTSETIARLANDIVQDLKSNRYYAVPGELAKYIGNVLALSERDAASTADANRRRRNPPRLVGTTARLNALPADLSCSIIGFVGEQAVPSGRSIAHVRHGRKESSLGASK